LSAKDPIQKRDLRGSRKQFPAILAGTTDIWLVEGGVTGLATVDLFRRRGLEPPTIVVTGGAGVTSFLENRDVQVLLRAALTVVIAVENEKDAVTQVCTDTAHNRQATRIANASDAEILMWCPPLGFGDLAEMNAFESSYGMVLEGGGSLILFPAGRHPLRGSPEAGG
jgi:hypothetical protein